MLSLVEDLQAIYTATVNEVAQTEGEVFGDITKDELRAIVIAADQWVSKNFDQFAGAIDDQKGALTTKQRAILLKQILIKRYLE